MKESKHSKPRDKQDLGDSPTIETMKILKTADNAKTTIKDWQKKDKW